MDGQPATSEAEVPPDVQLFMSAFAAPQLSPEHPATPNALGCLALGFGRRRSLRVQSWNWSEFLPVALRKVGCPFVPSLRAHDDDTWRFLPRRITTNCQLLPRRTIITAHTFCLLVRRVLVVPLPVPTSTSVSIVSFSVHTFASCRSLCCTSIQV